MTTGEISTKLTALRRQLRAATTGEEAAAIDAERNKLNFELERARQAEQQAAEQAERLRLKRAQLNHAIARAEAEIRHIERVEIPKLEKEIAGWRSRIGVHNGRIAERRAELDKLSDEN